MLMAAVSTSSPQRPLDSHQCPEQWLNQLAQLGTVVLVDGGDKSWL